MANVVEAGEHRIRVGEEWAGYPSSRSIGSYARADAATDVLAEAFPRPNDAPASAPPPAVHAEFSRLFATLPLDADFWGWVRERMVLMATVLGLPADLARLETYLTPQDTHPSALRTRAYALEALARRTGRDTRCDGGRRLADEAAAAAARSLTATLTEPVSGAKIPPPCAAPTASSRLCRSSAAGG